MIFEKKFETRRITRLDRKPAGVLRKDLERYRGLAKELGSNDAVIIPAGTVKFDERVRIKCRVPMCHLYGSSPNCPPYTPDVETMKKAMKKYRWALLVKYDVPQPEDFIDQEKWLKGHEKHQRKMHDIISVLESVAFNDGYYFAVGFSAGGCKTALCSGMICQFLDSGRCRFPLKSRPSMEGVGIDGYDLAARAGWEIYPVASRYSEPGSIKCAVSIGILFVN